MFHSGTIITLEQIGPQLFFVYIQGGSKSSVLVTMITCSSGETCHHTLALNRLKIDFETMFLIINSLWPDTKT